MLNGAYADDESFLVLMNTHWEAHEFSLPVVTGFEWEFVFSTHPMVKSGLRVGREQKELVLPRTICVYVLKKQVKPKNAEEKNQDSENNNLKIDETNDKDKSDNILGVNGEEFQDADSFEENAGTEKGVDIEESSIFEDDGDTENAEDIEDNNDEEDSVTEPDDRINIGNDSSDLKSGDSDEPIKKYRGIRPDLDDEEPT